MDPLKYYARQLKNEASRRLLLRKREINASPIIVTGNQKSGTSAIASLLAAAMGEQSTVDIFDKFGRLEYRLLDGRMGFEDFMKRSAPYWSCKVVKEPEFFLFLGEIRSRFPDCPVVYIVRDPYSNIRSILDRLGLSCRQAEMIKPGDSGICPGAPLWDLFFDPDRMPYGGRNGLEMLARRWSHAVNVYKAANVVGNVHLVKYEDFMRGKKAFIEKLVVDLGYSVCADISSGLDVQFQPKGRVKARDEFFSSEQIDMISAVCAPQMRVVGYE